LTVPEFELSPEAAYLVETWGYHAEVNRDRWIAVAPIAGDMEVVDSDTDPVALAERVHGERYDALFAFITTDYLA
jgi:hypothetical protein